MKKTILNSIIFLIFLLMKNNTINTMNKTNIQLSKIEKVYSQKDGKRICLECNKSFGNFARHMRTHTGEKPYQCNVCGEEFSDRTNCNRHQKNHTGEKPFQCRFCENKFTLKYNCITHEKTHNYITNKLEKKNNEKAIIINNYQNLIELESLFNSDEVLNSFQTITHPTSFNQLK